MYTGCHMMPTHRFDPSIQPIASTYRLAKLPLPLLRLLGGEKRGLLLLLLHPQQVLLLVLDLALLLLVFPDRGQLLHDRVVTFFARLQHHRLPFLRHAPVPLALVLGLTLEREVGLQKEEEEDEEEEEEEERQIRGEFSVRSSVIRCHAVFSVIFPISRVIIFR